MVGHLRPFASHAAIGLAALGRVVFAQPVIATTARSRIRQRHDRLRVAVALAIGGNLGSKLGFLLDSATSRKRLRGVTPRYFASQAALPNAGRSLELSRAVMFTFTAGDRTRTGNVQLGRLVLYH